MLADPDVEALRLLQVTICDSRAFGVAIWGAGLAALVAIRAVGVGAQEMIAYRIESKCERSVVLLHRLTDSQRALLEKLNRADVDHLERLQEVVLPVSWTDDELSYSVLPLQYAASAPWPKFVVIYLPGQLFGAYEFGGLVRWGPISSGRRNSPTHPGLFALNWRSMGHASTVDPDWFLPWYFNFGNRGGLALHAYSLPGYPASHGCIRLLERDARVAVRMGRSLAARLDANASVEAGNSRPDRQTLRL